MLDPHKGLFLPFGTGAVVVREEDVLAAAFTETANYRQDARDAAMLYAPADLGPELTRPFRGLRMWLPLKLFGVEAFRACLEEKLLLARNNRRLGEHGNRWWGNAIGGLVIVLCVVLAIRALLR